MSGMIALTGGIGSGKSVVARILRIKGFTVADTDSLARRIMDADSTIKEAIAAKISPACIADGAIVRPVLSEIVFNDKRKLHILNEIVHSAVKAELKRMADAHTDKFIFVETALPYSGGLWSMCLAEWRVDAPVHVRVDRVGRRNGLSKEQVLARIKSQEAELLTPAGAPRPRIIINDGYASVLRQVNRLLESFV